MPAFEWPAILDHSSEPAFVHDEQYRILRCNAAYAARAGSSIPEVLGKRYWELWPKMAGAPPPCQVHHSVEGAELPIIRADDGHIFAVHEMAAPCPAGNFWYCLHLFEETTTRTQLELDLAREKAIADAIVECAPNAFFLVDEDGRLVRWNRYLREHANLPDEKLLGYPVLSLILEEDRELASVKLLTALASGSTHMEFRIGGNGSHMAYFLTTARRLLIDGRPHVAGFCVDITDRKRAETLLEEQKRFLDVLVENIPGVFCVLDDEGRFVRWNSNLNKLTGLPDEALHRKMSLLAVVEEDRAPAAAKLRQALEQGYVKALLRVISKDRGPRAYLMTGRRFDMGDTPYVIGVGIDATDQVAMIADLEREARVDGLTQIANRGHFIHRAEDEFARSQRYGHALSIWMLDLDNFKDVNDRHGHQAGDSVLRAFVTVCRDALRNWDVMGRMGGEEFGVLLPETDPQQAMLVAERLRQAVAATAVPVGPDTKVSVTVSIGIATMTKTDADVHALFARADRALYDAKNTGRDKVCVA